MLGLRLFSTMHRRRLHIEAVAGAGSRTACDGRPAEARAACLPTAFRFGALPRATQAKYEDAASSYSFGWSHGKEKLEGGATDERGGDHGQPELAGPVALELPHHLLDHLTRMGTLILCRRR